MLLPLPFLPVGCHSVLPAQLHAAALMPGCLPSAFLMCLPGLWVDLPFCRRGHALGQSWPRGQGRKPRAAPGGGAGSFLATARTSSALRFFPFIVDLQPWNLMSTPVSPGKHAPAHLILSIAPFPRVLCIVSHLLLPKTSPGSSHDASPPPLLWQQTHLLAMLAISGLGLQQK